MGGYKREVLLYIAGTALLSATMLVQSYLYLPGTGNASWTTLGILAVLAAVSHLYPVKSAQPGVFYVLANVFVFAGVLLLPGWQVALLCAIAPFPATMRQPNSAGLWVRYTFNVAQSALAAQAAGSVLLLSGARDMQASADMVWVCLAIVVFVSVQAAAVMGVMYLNRRSKTAKLNGITLNDQLAQCVTAFMGAITAGLWHTRPWLLIFSLVPLVAIYRLMRNLQLVTLADLDPKTMLYNFRYFQQAAKEELTRSSELRRPVALLFCDLDYLREINNTHGHLAGDVVLEQLAKVLTREMPKQATISRFGGEEFVVVLPGTDREEAAYVADRLRLAVKQHKFDLGSGVTLQVTMSIGVAGAPEDGTDLPLLMERADKAVYKAKSLGRNRVCLYCEELDGAPMERPVAPPPTANARPTPSVPPPLAPVATPSRTDEVQQNETAPTSDADADRPRLLVIGVALAVALYSLSQFHAGYPWVLLTACILPGIAAEFLPVSISTPSRHVATVTPAVAVSMAAGALLGPSGAVAVALCSSLTHTLGVRGRHLVRSLFNAALVVISSFVSGLIFEAAGVTTPSRVTVIHLGVALLATLANFLLNTGLLAWVMSHRTKDSLRHTWSSSFGWLAPQFVFMGLAGAFAVYAFHEIGLVGALIALVPVLIARYSFSLSAGGQKKSVEQLRQAKLDLEKLHRAQSETLDQLIATISSMIDARDASVRGHSDKVARYAVALAREMGVSDQEQASIRLGALLHDLGKVGVPESILHKPAKLSPDEWAIMREHAAVGERILRQITALDGIARIVGEHHERWDGKGYPYGRKGEEISLGARIVSVADTLDTIITGRPYAPARSVQWAIDEICSCAGQQFDPRVVEALVRLADRKGPDFFATPPSLEQRLSQRSLA